MSHDFNFLFQVKGKTHTDANLASSDESLKDTLKETSDEKTDIPDDGETHIPDDANKKTSSAQVQFQQHVVEETAEKKPTTANEILPETHAEGDDGWQPVQRPRSTGSYGRRLKRGRGIIGKVYGYQKKIVDTDMDYTPVKNAHQNSRYYLLKKRALSHGSYADHHATNPSQSTKFGRRLVKAVTYRVKSISSNKNATTETSGSGKIFNSSLQSGPISAANDGASLKNSIVSLGKSPSYKEVALAPPGTIAKLQVGFPQSDIPNNLEIAAGKHEEDTNEAKENAGLVITGVEDLYEENDKNSALDSTDQLKNEVDVVEKKEESLSTDVIEDNSSLMVPQNVQGTESSVVVHEVIQNTELIASMPNLIDSHPKEPCEQDSLTEFESQGNSDSLPGVEDLKDKPSVMNSGDTQGFPNKKLSASAAPFNPSTSVARPVPLAINIPLPSGPGAVPAVAPWPVNMTLHPGPATVLPAVNPMSSPHHPYSSPPPTPNMIQPLPFMYPPYSQTQAVPSSTFPVTSSAFHPNHFSWQCSVNPNVLEFIPSTVWPGCHAVEFSVPPCIVEPIADVILEPKVQFENSESSNPASILPVDIDSAGKAKKEVNFQALEAMDNGNGLAGDGLESVKENGHSNLSTVEISGNNSSQKKSQNENGGSSGDRKIDGEKTFSILLRGRRNRKQTLRMPISLLSRPYGSQSFKVIYNRVVRGSEAPKSISFSSSEDSTASAT